MYPYNRSSSLRPGYRYRYTIVPTIQISVVPVTMNQPQGPPFPPLLPLGPLPFTPPFPPPQIFPPPPPPLMNPVMWQSQQLAAYSHQHPAANAMPWSGNYGGSTSYPAGGPVLGNHQHQQQPSSGPSRSRKRRKEQSPKAVPPPPYHNVHESSGMVSYDRSTGIHPGHARIDANNHPGMGQVWRTPSKKLLMHIADCNLT